MTTEYYDDPHWPTVKKLTDYLESIKAPPRMILDARQGRFHDFLSEFATPLVDLYKRAYQHGLRELMEKVKEGEFDAEPAEGEYYFNDTEEGRAIMSELPPKMRKEMFGIDW